MVNLCEKPQGRNRNGLGAAVGESAATGSAACGKRFGGCDIGRGYCVRVLRSADLPEVSSNLTRTIGF